MARSRTRKAVVKMHTRIDLRGNIPVSIRITNGRAHDVNVLDRLPFEPGSFCVMDRGHVDFQLIYRLTLAAAFSVTRPKSNIVLIRCYWHPGDPTTNVRSDHTVVLGAPGSAKHCPAALRRVRYFDAEHSRFLVFPTNNIDLQALTNCLLYKSRWAGRPFFKRIKQYLGVKPLYATNENAVRSQFWIAVSVYLPVVIVKKEMKLDASLWQPREVASVTIFERVRISQALQLQDSYGRFRPIF